LNQLTRILQQSISAFQPFKVIPVAKVAEIVDFKNSTSAAQNEPVEPRPAGRS